jgi:hypothetical protein
VTQEQLDKFYRTLKQFAAPPVMINGEPHYVLYQMAKKKKMPKKGRKGGMGY